MYLWKLGNYTNDDFRSQSVLHPHILEVKPSIWEDLTSKRIPGRLPLWIWEESKHFAKLLLPWLVYTLSPEWPLLARREKKKCDHPDIRKLESWSLKRDGLGEQLSPSLASSPRELPTDSGVLLRWVPTPDRDSWEQMDKDNIRLYHEVLGLLWSTSLILGYLYTTWEEQLWPIVLVKKNQQS